MIYEICNLTNRSVSIHCNSGETCHLPPGFKHQLPKQELTGNAYIKKLQDRKIISVSSISENKSAPSARKESASGDKAAGTNKPSKKTVKQTSN